MNNLGKANRLINEKSPYLLQHAHNPVDWYPWGEEAFAKAQKEDKPLLVSIGYSTCHWCHVMERESFEDQQVGEILNQYFVAIKVDREERPDIDHIYMAACQAITGQGGWPLTIIMTPDKKPFFAGTYFPKESHYGRPGFIELLLSVKDEWAKNKTNLSDIGEKLTVALQKQKNPEAGKITEEDFHLTFQHFSNHFDPNLGGFGAAPKFPTPHNLMFLLRYYQRYHAPRSLEMVEKTLRAMYQGGIYDHIGHGFSRYSTDREWLVPHFEKMLYDNALLAIAYLETYQVTHNPLYRQVAENIFHYVLRDMTDPEGGFYSAEDADSEGEEGKFYLWNQAEVSAVLGEEYSKTFCHRYDITATGNFEGKSIPNLINQNLEPASDPSLWETWRQQLFQARENRIHPLKDDKILTAWNGLMIAALAKGSQVLQNKTYQLAAIKSADFIWHHLRDKEGRLLARYRQGESAFAAYLDDYAFLAWGLLELYQATFDSIFIDRALALSQEMIQLFWDEENSGFFFSGNDNETLITKSKEIYDGAIPSGNSVAALVLIKLARLTDDENLQKYAEKQIDAFAGEVAHYLPGHSFFILASMLQTSPPYHLVVAGDREETNTTEMLKTAQKIFSPDLTTLFNPLHEKVSEATLPLLQDKLPVNDQGAAYICRDFACQPPLGTPEELLQALQ